jgi:hypothetical protein
MKTRYEKMIRLLMLAAGLLLLLTVIIPHHHHEDGLPCIFLWDGGSEEDGEAEGEAHHDCESNGHTLAFNTKSLQNQATETHDLALLLIPLYTLFDYINPLLPSPDDWVFDSERSLYAESLFCIWLVEAAGFRAPPQANI